METTFIESKLSLPLLFISSSFVSHLSTTRIGIKKKMFYEWNMIFFK